MDVKQLQNDVNNVKWRKYRNDLTILSFVLIWWMLISSAECFNGSTAWILCLDSRWMLASSYDWCWMGYRNWLLVTAGYPFAMGCFVCRGLLHPSLNILTDGTRRVLALNCHVAGCALRQPGWPTASLMKVRWIEEARLCSQSCFLPLQRLRKDHVKSSQVRRW